MQQETLEEYQAVRTAVGFLDLSDRGKIEVTGLDRVTFLHSMISNDVKELPEWAGRYGTFLTARGRIISDCFYYRFPDDLLLDLSTDLLARTIEVLEKHIIMDQVSLKDVSEERNHFSLQGPAASELVQELFGDCGPAQQYAVQKVAWQDTTLLLIRKDELAECGFEMILPQQIASSLQGALQEKGSSLGLREIGREARNILRLEAGIPWYGIDMNEKSLPHGSPAGGSAEFHKGMLCGAGSGGQGHPHWKREQSLNGLESPGRPDSSPRLTCPQFWQTDWGRYQRCLFSSLELSHRFCLPEACFRPPGRALSGGSCRGRIRPS